MNFDKYEIAGAYHWRETNRRYRDYNPPLVARYQVLLDRIKSVPTLDVGGGDGYLSARIGEFCPQVFSLEYDEKGASLAKTMLRDIDNVAVIQGDTFRLPFGDKQLDQVVMADVIEHLENPERAVKEIARVLSDEGQFCLTTPMWRPDRMWDRYHVKEYKPEEMYSLLTAAFGELEFTYFWPLKWSNLYSTKLGWRLLKYAGRLGFNPFARTSDNSMGMGQMLVIARQPVRD